jgi:hypothetical protein
MLPHTDTHQRPNARLLATLNVAAWVWIVVGAALVLLSPLAWVVLANGPRDQAEGAVASAITLLCGGVTAFMLALVFVAFRVVLRELAESRSVLAILRRNAAGGA